MCDAAAGARAPVNARDEVLSLLRDDFHRVLDEFREFERLDGQASSQAGQRIAQRTFAELKVIADVEQQLLYPAVRDALAGTDLIDQSEIETTCIRRLVDRLERVQPDAADYPAGFRILGQHVRLHVADEEAELFPVLRCAGADWERLYDDMRTRRAELAEDLGIAARAPAERSAGPRYDLPIHRQAIDEGEVLDETAEA